MTTLLTITVSDGDGEANGEPWGDGLRADLTTLAGLADANAAKLVGITTTVADAISDAVDAVSSPGFADGPVAVVAVTGVYLRTVFTLTRVSASSAWPGSRPTLPTGCTLWVIGPGDDPSWFVSGQDLRSVTL